MSVNLQSSIVLTSDRPGDFLRTSDEHKSIICISNNKKRKHPPYCILYRCSKTKLKTVKSGHFTLLLCVCVSLSVLLRLLVPFISSNQLWMLGWTIPIQRVMVCWTQWGFSFKIYILGCQRFSGIDPSACWQQACLFKSAGRDASVIDQKMFYLTRRQLL